jgi:hypothetical protein
VFAWVIAPEGTIAPTGWLIGGVCLAAVGSLVPVLLRRPVAQEPGVAT